MNSHIQNSTNLSTTLEVYNSTHRKWATGEDLKLSTISNRTVENFEISPNGTVENVEISPTALWLYYAVRIIWGCLAILCNSLTILVVTKFERLQTCTNYLICSLAVSDMLSGVIVPLMMVHELFPNSSFFIPICLLEKTLGLLSTCGNMLMIFYLSVDGYIYIAHALRYSLLVTAQRTFIVLGITWTINLIIIPVIVFSGNHLQIDMVCQFFILLDPLLQNYYFVPQGIIIVFLTTGFHLAIAKIAYRQAQAIAAQQQPYDTLATAINKSTKKISCTLGLVLGVYLLCLVPQVIMTAVTREHKSLLPLQNFTIILYWSNAWVNPLIYAWRLKDFRIAFRKLLKGTGSFNEVP